MSYGIKKFFFFLTYCLVCCGPGLGAKSGLRVVRQWKELEFNFPSEAAKKKAYETGYYLPGKAVPIDVDIHYRPGLSAQVFITIPRFDKGRAVTLGIVDEQGRINPYPNYSWHENPETNCNGFISIYRIAISECNLLWVLDDGKLEDTRQVCPPKLLAFDLSTNRVLFRHVFNESTYTSDSLFVTPVVDVRNKQDCSGTFVYVADISGFALVVVDVDRNRSWKINHRLFYPFPSRGSFTIDGESFDLMDGVLGMALSPLRPGQDRSLYFHALASTTENVVSTRILQNDSFIRDSNADIHSINVFPSERPSQSAAEAMDRDGILYFGLMDPPSIWCWNSDTEFTPDNFHKVALDRETLQFASGVKVVNNILGEQELWVLTSSFQRYMTGSLNSSRVNFRIHAEKISKLQKSSGCAKD